MKRFLPQTVLIIMSLGFLIFWFWALPDVGRTTAMTCTHIEPGLVNCTLRQSWMGRIAIKTETISSIRSASWDEDCGDDCFYNVVLHTPNQTIAVRAAEGDKVKLDQINALINNQLDARDLELTFGGDWFEVILFVGVGLVIASAFLLPWVLDRSIGSSSD